MALWSAGTTMVIFLAGLQDVPSELYEAAEIDGAGWWRKLVHVTLPCLSPVIYFSFLVGLIGALQVFTPAYIIGGGPSGGTLGAPARSTLFYTLYLWAQGFEWLRMGYASAMALLLFIVIVVLTLTAHRVVSRHVTYQR
jgi:multiple sugar transport system permease protein